MKLGTVHPVRLVYLEMLYILTATCIVGATVDATSLGRFLLMLEVFQSCNYFLLRYSKDAVYKIEQAKYFDIIYFFSLN